MKDIFPPFGAIGEPELVFSDERFIVVFKPAGIHSAGAGKFGDESAPTLLRWVLKRFSTEAPTAPWGSDDSPRGRRPYERSEFGMLNRLDRDTSGLVIFAKDGDSFEDYLRLQGRGGVNKFYIALASFSGLGLPGSRPRFAETFFKRIELLGPARGEPVAISSAFGSFGPRGAKVRCVAVPDQNIRPESLTGKVYTTEVLSKSTVGYPNERSEANPYKSGASPQSFSFQLLLHSGFRHQIRAHLAWAGFPLLGDVLYGGKGAERLFLESRGIEFTLSDGYRLEVHC